MRRHSVRRKFASLSEPLARNPFVIGARWKWIRPGRVSQVLPGRWRILSAAELLFVVDLVLFDWLAVFVGTFAVNGDRLSVVGNGRMNRGDDFIADFQCPLRHMRIDLLECDVV